MRMALSGLALVLVAAGFQEQEESLEARRDRMLKSPFLARSAWFTDYAKAKAESARTGRPIFAYFTRSYSP